MLRAVTFDATGTLLHSPRRGEIYAETLERHGVAVTPAEAERLIRLVWQELACRADPAYDRFAAHPEGPRGWWARFLERLCEHLGAPPPSRFAAAELYHRFAQPEAWEVYPEVPAVLENLRARELKLAVIANWDDRLPPLLAALDLADYFEDCRHVLSSRSREARPAHLRFRARPPVRPLLLNPPHRRPPARGCRRRRSRRPPRGPSRSQGAQISPLFSSRSPPQVGRDGAPPPGSSERAPGNAYRSPPPIPARCEAQARASDPEVHKKRAPVPGGGAPSRPAPRASAPLRPADRLL